MARSDPDPGALEMTEPTFRYGIVFLLLTTIYIGASASETEWMTPLIMALAAALLLVLAVPTRPKRHHFVSFLLVWVVATVLAGVLANLGRRATGVADLLVAAMLLFAIYLIARGIVNARRVTIEAVIGAVDMYVLLGLAFGFAFSGLERISETPFFSTELISDRSDFLYFSFVAMTTLGFGDLAPADNYARPLTVLEVLTGQIILVVVVARVVSMLGPRQPQPTQDT